ncbi:MAG TPA: ribbon-helix-helix protein, CopG family [Mycobacteriales bacterium]|nr:ribbon-helix-helix protein, CopG family [Mycobacteriales bacterium]
MRTTVTLDDDVAAAVQRLASERGQSFKAALNTLLRTGLATETVSSRPYEMPARPMGLRPGIDLGKALRLAGDLEDEETLRKLQLRK